MIPKLNRQIFNPISSKTQTVKRSDQPKNKDLSFNQILHRELIKTDLKFSKHADMRMKSLGIIRTQDLDKQLEVATNKAKQKNIQEGLILTDDYGFVVSIKNNTVITVVPLKDMEDNVFTNIDGAVII